MFNCYICAKNDFHKMPKWNPARELLVCKNCGNVCFEVDPKEEDKVKKYYRDEYRGSITEENLLTTNRKLQYFISFIKPWLLEKEKSDEKLVVGDVGCATGFILNWFKQRGHKATGSEWTPIMRRFAEHYYGLFIKEELETKREYDLISIYHVLEHMVEPDKKLKHYASLLKEDGRLLVSCPTWFDVLENTSGRPIGDYTEYFHKDHINCFSKGSMINLFNICGLEVVQEDFITHGQTFLLKKCAVKVIKKEEWNVKVQQIETIKKTIDFWHKDKFEEALDLWPLFPEAYTDWIYKTSVKKDPDRAIDIIKRGLDLMPENTTLLGALSTILYQKDRLVEVLKISNALIKVKQNENLLMYRGWTNYKLGNLPDAMKDFEDAANMNPLKWAEANRWITKICTEIPGWEDRAKQQILETVLKSGKVEMAPDDPQFKENGKDKNDAKTQEKEKKVKV